MIQNRKQPSQHSKNVEIRKLGTWLSNQKHKYKNTQIMKDPEIRLKYEEFLNEYQQYFT